MIILAHTSMLLLVPPPCPLAPLAPLAPLSPPLGSADRLRPSAAGSVLPVRSNPEGNKVRGLGVGIAGYGLEVRGQGLRVGVGGLELEVGVEGERERK